MHHGLAHLTPYLSYMIPLVQTWASVTGGGGGGGACCAALRSPLDASVVPEDGASGGSRSRSGMMAGGADTSGMMARGDAAQVMPRALRFKASVHDVEVTDALFALPVRPPPLFFACTKKVLYCG